MKSSQVVATVCVLGVIFFNQASHAVQAQTTAPINSADGQAIWNETKYPVVRTLAELRRMQREVGHRAYEVDLTAQLTFSARYWSVFFVQDGDLPAMVHCTDAASAILHSQPMGKWLRIRGLVYDDHIAITLVGFDLLPDVSPVPAMRLQSVPPIDDLPLDRVVEMPCRLLEVLDKYNQSVMFAQVNEDVIELHVGSYLNERQYAAVASGSLAIATGTFSPKFEWTRFSNCAIRMMSTDQLRILDESPALELPAAHTKIEGQVFFTDNMGQIVVGNEDQVWRVDTRFAEQFKPMQDVVVSGKPVAPDDGGVIVAQQMKLERDSQFAPAVELSVGNWELVKKLPRRVTLEAIVVAQSVKEHLRTYHMRSANKRFTAIVNEMSDPRELFRAGDRIRLTGTPLVDRTLEPQTQDRLKLYVIDPADTQFVSAPVQLSMAHVGWAASIGLVLVGIVFSWNWLLHRKVNSRTKGLKKLSSHLRMSFEAISEAVLVTDAERCVSTWNRQFEQLFGGSPAESQPIDGPLASIRNRLVDPSVFAPISRASETQVANPVSVILNLENPTQIVRAFVSGIVDSDGTYHGHLYTFEDITEKQRLENELFQSQKMEAIGQLSGGVAHDFNNLLTIVASNLALIKFLDSPVGLEYVSAAETAVKRAAELTQQLLDFSRRSKLEKQTVNLNDLVGRIGVLLRRTFDRSVSLQVELSSTPLFVSIDINRLEQVLINILINARDALKGRNGKIIVRVSPITEDDGKEATHACLEIEDNGCGMSREVQARIFDPFFTTKKPGEGTGLGLSMAQGVVEQLGGRIVCHSKLDVGTRFRIQLPLTEPAVSLPNTSVISAVKRSRPLRILLVDDEPMVRSSGQALLRSLGHLVLVAPGGQEALDILHADGFDVVLLDLTMPNLGGKETYIEIHQRWPDLPVAICTGYDVDLQSWNSDCDVPPPKIISKPYSVDSLSNYLNSIQCRPASV